MSILTWIEHWLTGASPQLDREAKDAHQFYRESVHGSRNVNFIAQHKNAVTKCASEHTLTVAEQAIRRMEKARRDDEERRHATD